MSQGVVLAGAGIRKVLIRYHLGSLFKLSLRLGQRDAALLRRVTQDTFFILHEFSLGGGALLGLFTLSCCNGCLGIQMEEEIGGAEEEVHIELLCILVLFILRSVNTHDVSHTRHMRQLIDRVRVENSRREVLVQPFGASFGSVADVERRVYNFERTDVFVVGLVWMVGIDHHPVDIDVTGLVSSFLRLH